MRHFAQKYYINKCISCYFIYDRQGLNIYHKILFILEHFDNNYNIIFDLSSLETPWVSNIIKLDSNSC